MEEHGEAGIIMKLCRRAKEYAGAVAWNWLGNNILHGYTFGKLKKNTDYMKLSESCGKDGERVVLLDTPLHGNLGDQAIALAEREFIGEIVGVDRLFEFTSAECRANLSDIVKKITEKDIVVIHGGGFIGTLWPEEEKVFLRILDCLKEKRIIVFPQTIYFDRTKAGKRELRRFIHAVKACRDITVFARDRKSYIWLKNGEILPSHKFYLVPDIVMSYQKPHDERSKRKKIVWLCLRRDQEKMLDDSVLKVLMVKLKASGYCVELTDTVVEGKINPKERGDAVNEKLNQFAQGALVITDRLHGMVFSALSETPCIALDNVSKKVSGGYEWLRCLDYIKCVTERELTMDLVMEMLCKENCRFENDCLQPYYELIRNQIRCENL